MATIKESAVVTVEAGSDAVELLLVFPLADQWFALPAQNVVAVVEADRLQALADDSGNLVGSIEFHGSEVLVRDITALLVPGVSGEPAEQIKETKQLKTKLACGGTAKEGKIELQGNHIQKVKEVLLNIGFPPDTIVIKQ